MINIEHVELGNLTPYVNNARTHSDSQITQIAASIKEFGFNNPILLADDNTIIAGHGRFEAAKKIGLQIVPCVYLSHLSETQRKAYVLADNRIAMNAGWDEQLLALDLKELEQAEFDMDLLGFSTEEIDELIKDNSKSYDEEKQDQIPETDQNEFGVERGQIWQLGDHRLMCGDSTSKEDVERLMAGEKADMVFTDPPYGVSYTKKAKEVLGSNQYVEIENDDRKGDDLGEFFREVFLNMRSMMTDTCSYYVCSPQGGDSEMMMMMMRESGMKCRHQLIWVKDSPVFSMGRLDYDYKHEPILYGWTKKHSFQRKGSQDKSVWEFKRVENKLHPTMKPVELIENALLNSGGEVVMDLFLGSGSTLIACEKTGRKCYGMEIDPHYCSVIIKRWQEFTGMEAKKLNA